MGARRTSRPVRRVLSPVPQHRRAAIHLGLPSPAGSSGLPAGSGGQPSNACAGHRLAAGTLLALLRVGFTEPPRSPGVLVGSYPTVSPLPRGRPKPVREAVCFLWHFPAGRPGLPLATTLLCGVRTFLGSGLRQHAVRSRRRDRTPTRSLVKWYSPRPKRVSGLAHATLWRVNRTLQTGGARVVTR